MAATFRIAPHLAIFTSSWSSVLINVDLRALDGKLFKRCNIIFLYILIELHCLPTLTLGLLPCVYQELHHCSCDTPDCVVHLSNYKM